MRFHHMLRALPQTMLLAMLTASSWHCNGHPPPERWLYQYAVNTADFSCTSPPVDDQTITGTFRFEFGGRYPDLVVSCSGDGLTFQHYTIPAGRVSGKTRTGSQVSFAFEVPGGSWVNNGTVLASNRGSGGPAAMEGQVTATVSLAGTVVTLTGYWSATKLPE